MAPLFAPLRSSPLPSRIPALAPGTYSDMAVEIVCATSDDLDELAALFSAYRIFFNPDADVEVSRPFLAF